MPTGLIKDDCNYTAEEGGRFFDIAYSSPTNLYNYLHIRLVPKLHEFEKAKGKDGKSFVNSQLQRWLTAFQSAFNTVVEVNDEFSEYIFDRKWKTATASMCKSEVEQRHKFIIWARGADPKFKYKKYKDALEFFDMPTDQHYSYETYLPFNDNKFRNLPSIIIKNDNVFNDNHDLIKYYLKSFYEKEILKYLLKRSITQLNDDWKKESVRLFNDSEFDVMKKLHTKHRAKLFEKSPKYPQFIKQFNKEKLDRQRQRDLKKQSEINSAVNNEENRGKV